MVRVVLPFIAAGAVAMAVGQWTGFWFTPVIVLGAAAVIAMGSLAAASLAVLWASGVAVSKMPARHPGGTSGTR